MYRIAIQFIAEKTLAPKPVFLRKWAKQALSKKRESGEITIRVVDENEMTTLNHKYRHKSYPTNVLSFPFEMPKEIDFENIFLGDIVICATVVNREAEEQHKSQDAHWAHMIVHGVFHLLGYDHEEEKEATLMESLEIEVMQTLGFHNPYAS